MPAQSQWRSDQVAAGHCAVPPTGAGLCRAICRRKVAFRGIDPRSPRPVGGMVHRALGPNTICIGKSPNRCERESKWRKTLEKAAKVLKRRVINFIGVFERVQQSDVCRYPGGRRRRRTDRGRASPEARPRAPIRQVLIHSAASGRVSVTCNHRTEEIWINRAVPDWSNILPASTKWSNRAANLLRCMSPELARRRSQPMSARTSAFRGEADSLRSL